MKRFKVVLYLIKILNKFFYIQAENNHLNMKNVNIELQF